MARNAWNCARRHAAFGDLVPFITGGFAVILRGSDQLTAVNFRIKREFLRIDRGAAFREEQVAEDDSRALESIRDVENLGHEVEAVQNVGRRCDDARKVAEARTEHLPEVTLLRLGRNAG